MAKSDDKRDGRVLLTGGSGFIASHVLDALLDTGFSVVVTARSEEKGKSIVESVKPHHLSYVVVEDIATEGAFDHVFRTQAPFDYVVHTASPYHLNVDDPVKDFLDPAIKGTTGLLKSIKAHGATVKRVVITSSSAAVLNPDNHAKVYDETHWAPTTLEDAIKYPAKHGYRASKVLAEKAAWAFVADEKPKFDLAVINCTYVFGPIQRKLPSLEAMNASNHRIRDMLQGKMRDGVPPTMPVFTWVDVRDVALAHLRAMTVPKAGGNRFYVVGGHFTNKQIVDIIRDKFPSLADRFPADTVSDLPDDVYNFNNSKSREVLGIEYTSLQKTITARQVITQTITNDDYTTTAVVTLGPGDPSSTPLNSPSDSQGSSGLSSAGIGILVGSIVGAIILAILVWMCCLRHRMEDYDDDETEYDPNYDMMQPPPRVYVRFPHSIPPPVVPTYTAVPIRRSYTSHDAARRASSSYIIYDDDPRRTY
ncbi:hypothetical protein F5B22DRAFT_640310 [Xylaria bambusicola]|uniref:uncharacterized protein n=1 Tax=Xylaria bambusicola TaxID=326684 RepID=UPI00200816D3|nr:uncharacterized protein F5B22DRAFT_640310 [Xylaria bambusicola]KAI0503207.1 hypothetical protein F5B22DRAFT_640310 [Xylaria bambusicola]